MPFSGLDCGAGLIILCCGRYAAICMEDSSSIDLAQLANHLKLDLASLQRTVELLEVGNTVPFITRFRKDQTGGLDEQQIRTIQRELARGKQLLERKESILKSIESRQLLTPELRDKITAARTMGILEDLYLPYKPKKKSLAFIARSRGLGPFAEEILSAKPGAPSLDDEAIKRIDPEQELADKDAVLTGVQHLLAEHFCNDSELRSMLRRHFWQHGQLVSKKIDEPAESDDDPSDAPAATQTEATPAEPTPKPTTELTSDGTATTNEDAPPESTAAATDTNVDSTSVETNAGEANSADATSSETVSAEVSTGSSDSDAIPAVVSGTTPNEASEAKAAETADPASSPATVDVKAQKKSAAREQRRATRRRRRERLVQSFKDYFDFKDPLGRLPHHRILAINRGERTKVLRIKLECSNWDKLEKEVHAKVIDTEHPYAEFLGMCLQDSLNRLLIPSMEREVRRELNDKAEEHAVKVFAKNLRKLLLQPPLHQHRVVAIDPGFRSGCKVVALDEFGRILGHTFINLLGKDQQKEQGRQELAKFVREHKATVVAVGNGAACRETETLVGELLSNELAGEDVGYLIVNEAGTSVYSTSELGREELPDADPTVRSAVSIGRRALDPLSELVKVDPASIGVGLYQHDVKAKHLKESLDDVVESCVNYVGVDVNSASPSLLRYVSGLNKMTANQIYKHREKHGPFKNREELKSVSGVGESSYVQAAGFLKITGGENPLDGTWIHPESYSVANRVLAAIGSSPTDLQVGSLPTDKPDETDKTNVTDESGGPDKATAPEPAVPPPEPVSDAPSPEPVADAAGSESVAEATVPETASTSTYSARFEQLTAKLNAVDVDQLAPQLNVGKLLLRDILTALARPGRDPREDLPRPPFRKGVLKLENLRPGMELSGTVLNVVDFGAFVDIGLVDSGLIHVSRLADKYISDPHDVVSVGDVLRVWVIEVDNNRRRVSLTAIEPGTERPKRQREPRKPRAAKPKQQTQDAGGGQRKRRDDRRGKRGGSHKPKEFRAKAKPKPVVPITKEMETGKEPMRTFGDLKQLFEKKKKGDK